LFFYEERPALTPARGAATRSARFGFRPPSVVVLGELAAAAVVVEPADEHVRELAIDRGAIISEIAGPTVGDVDVAIDREDLVIGLP
jgi:hypothetical protein